ncbi:MAG: hypothetical protein EA381_16985 [Planctomycetaceae bacterium]|nr:MAG: hypothetical protein EA381_16985 [Planctomycetaceae bacterium]
MDQRDSIGVGENVVERLRRTVREARRLGFDIRQEVLSGQQPAWCEFGGKRWLFIDASQSAREQTESIEAVLANYRAWEAGLASSQTESVC